MEGLITTDRASLHCCCGGRALYRWSEELEGKVLMSCHSCDHTSDMSVRSAKHFGVNLARYVKGLPLKCVVDKQAGY